MASGSDPRKRGAGRKEERRGATGVRSFSLGEKVGGGGGHTVLLKSSRVTCLGLIPGHELLCASWPCVPAFWAVTWGVISGKPSCFNIP